MKKLVISNDMKNLNGMNMIIIQKRGQYLKMFHVHLEYGQE